MKKLILLAGIFISSISFGQTNIDSLKPILFKALIDFEFDEKASLLNSPLEINDSLLYHFYDVYTDMIVYLDSMETKEYVETILDPNLSSFLNHGDYYVKILPKDHPLYDGQSDYVLIAIIKSSIQSNGLEIQFNFNSYSNKLQYVAITHCGLALF